MLTMVSEAEFSTFLTFNEAVQFNFFCSIISVENVYNNYLDYGMPLVVD